MIRSSLRGTAFAFCCAALLVPCIFPRAAEAETYGALVGKNKITSISREKDKGVTLTKDDLLESARNAKPIKPIKIEGPPGTVKP